MLNNGVGGQYPGAPGQSGAGPYLGGPAGGNSQSLHSLLGYGMPGPVAQGRHGIHAGVQQGGGLNAGGVAGVTNNLQQLGLDQAPRVGLQQQQPYNAPPNGAAGGGRGPAATAGGMGGMRGYASLEGGYGANLAVMQRQLGTGSGGGGGRPGAPSYGAPSGDLLSMLNRAGGGHGGGGGRGEVPAFEATDFPSLGSSAAVPRPTSTTGEDGVHQDASFAALLGKAAPQQAPPTFQDDDFPALPGAPTLQQQQPQQQAQVQQQTQTQLPQTHQQAAGGSGPPAPVAAPSQPQRESSTTAAERLGLLGLLSVIRMTDPDLTTLALGTDLTTLGLNLSSAEPLWWTFGSPWADGPARDLDPEGRTPASFLLPGPRLTAQHFAAMQPDSLFFAFYATPGDEAQALAATELQARGWSFSRDLEAWITPATAQDPPTADGNGKRGSFFLFDPNAWEVVRKDDLTISFASLEPVPSAGGESAPPP